MLKARRRAVVKVVNDCGTENLKIVGMETYEKCQYGLWRAMDRREISHS